MPILDLLGHEITLQSFIRHSHTIVCTIGIILNILLLTLIAKTPHSVVGKYSYLLFSFSLCNFLYTVVDIFFVPTTILEGRTWMLVTLSPLFENPFLNYIPLMLYVCLFSQSVLLLMFQFVYRYAMVTRVAWTLDTHLSMGVVHEDVFAEMSGIYQRQFDGNLSAIGYLGQSYDPSANSRLWVAYFGTCNLLAMLAVSWAVIIYSGWKVYKTLHASSKVISEKTRRLQKELFKALIIQLTIPLFFNYTPMGVLFFSAMIGIPLKLELISLNNVPGDGSDYSYCGMQTPDKIVGKYSYLLFGFSLCNLVYAIADVMFVPVIMLSGRTFVLVDTAPKFENPTWNYLPLLLCCSLFCQTLVLLMFQFVYRYSVVCRNNPLPRQPSKNNIALAVSVFIGITIAWTTTTHFSMGAVGEDVSQAMRHIFTTNLGMDNIPNTGFLGQSYDPAINGSLWTAYIGICTLLSILGATEKTRRLQKQLFQALIIQLLIPMTFNYFPMGSVFSSAIFGIPLNLEPMTVLFMLDPILEPIVIIYFIKCYRKQLVRWALCKRGQVTSDWSKTMPKPSSSHHRSASINVQITDA
ncbi:unnamed protein product, partial [Mesorhabditis spiculigera]